MVKVTSLLAKGGSGLSFSFGVRAWTEMEIRCMYRLKLVSSKNNSVFKGLINLINCMWSVVRLDLPLLI